MRLGGIEDNSNCYASTFRLNEGFGQSRFVKAIHGKIERTCRLTDAPNRFIADTIPCNGGWREQCDNPARGFQGGPLAKLCGHLLWKPHKYSRLESAQMLRPH